MVEVYLGLGSNLGDREGNMARALELLGERGRVAAVSSLYETDPVGLAGPLFLNAVCFYLTELGPEELLSFVKGIEARLGRPPQAGPAPRPIDIDTLIYGDLVLKGDHLTIPHPRLAERAFVLVPLAELAPELVVPGRGQKVSQLLARVGREGVRPWRDSKFPHENLAIFVGTPVNLKQKHSGSPKSRKTFWGWFRKGQADV